MTVHVEFPSVRSNVVAALVSLAGDVDDKVYLASPRWPAVVAYARNMLEAMRADR